MGFHVRRVLLCFSFLMAVSGQPASAGPWSVTVYGGPATHYIFTDVVSGHFHWNSAVFAVAVDRRLAYLGWGWNLVGEGEYQQYTFGHNYNSIALGLGVEYHHFSWEDHVPTALSIYMGPSYSFNPPQLYPAHSFGSKKGLLNYISMELAFALPNTRRWDVVTRIYHRSGVWGIYTLDPDEVSIVGVGLRYRF